MVRQQRRPGGPTRTLAFAAAAAIASRWIVLAIAADCQLQHQASCNATTATTTSRSISSLLGCPLDQQQQQPCCSLDNEAPDALEASLPGPEESERIEGEPGSIGSKVEDSRERNWHHQYVEEQTADFELKIRDATTDERLANVVRTVNLGRLFTFYFYKYDSPLAGVSSAQLEQLAAGAKVNDTLCARHLSSMVEQLHQMRSILELRALGKQTNSTQAKVEAEEAKFGEQHLRLAKLLDSYGRYESGWLVGRTYSLGSYKQCRGSQLLLGDNNELVAGRYCLVNLDTSKHQHPSLKLYARGVTDTGAGTQDSSDDDLISVAVCLPESCHARNFASNKRLLQTLVNSQFELPPSLFHESHLELKSLFCEPDSDSQLRRLPLSGKLLIVFVAAWLGTLLFASTRANKNNATKVNGETQQADKTTLSAINKESSLREKFFECLDARESWRDLVGRDEDRCDFSGAQHRVSLNTLNAMKVLGCAIVVLGHSAMIQTTASADLMRTFMEIQTDPRIYFLLGATVIVDTFYVITGIMMAYIAMKRFTREAAAAAAAPDGATSSTTATTRRGKSFLSQCASFVLMRYLRLVPLYFLVFWFKKSLMTSLSEGPLWDHGYNKETEAGTCRAESWLTPFTFQAAYLPLSSQCMPHAWSVAGDLFFAFVVAPIIVGLARRPLLATLAGIAISLASNASMLAAVSSIDEQLMGDLRRLKTIGFSRIFKDWTFFYTAPHYRVFSVLVGVLAGYVLHHYSLASTKDQSIDNKAGADEKKRPNLRQWPHWFKGAATKASLYYVLVSLASLPLIPFVRNELIRQEQLVQVILLHMYTTHRLLWALSNAILFLRVITDLKDTYWARVAAGPLWTTMTKLNFAILLVHLDLLKLDFYWQLSLNYYTFYSIIKTAVVAYVGCIPVAVALFVLFENPVDKFVKTLTKGKN